MEKSWNDKLSLGKYKGKTIKEVFDINPMYLYKMLKTGYILLEQDVLDKIIEYIDKTERYH